MSTQTTPINSSELQLYRVLERANLLTYYDNFIQQGGDDVQQLCEAGEEEFLEIMALVGMATKPLHVRRLQKALQDWVTNPGAFEQPLTTPPRSIAPPVSELRLQPQQGNVPVSTPSVNVKWSAQTNMPIYSHATTSSSQLSVSRSGGISSDRAPSPAGSVGNPGNLVGSQYQVLPGAELDNASINNIRTAAIALMETIPKPDMPPQLNKKTMRELAYIFDMAVEDPRRIEEIRKWSAIYGRFDSKRRAEKALSLHETTVNEAAAQICAVDPYLLAQRDKLFPLARQVVRDSGYKFKHGHSRASSFKGDLIENVVAKRPRMDTVYRDVDNSPNPRTVQAELMKLRREERMNEISSQLSQIKQTQNNIKAEIQHAKDSENLQAVYDLQIELEKLTTQQLMLMTEQTDLIKKQRRSDRYYDAKARAFGEFDDVLGDGNSSVKSPSHEGDNDSGNRSANSSPMPEDHGGDNSTSVNPSVYVSQMPKVKQGQTQKLMMRHTLLGEGLRIAQQHAYPELSDQNEVENHTNGNGNKSDEEMVGVKQVEDEKLDDNTKQNKPFLNNDASVEEASETAINEIINLTKKEPLSAGE
ncbi:NGFI-A-binding protein 1-like isoform X2 [Anneissia japonica]|uniref:NGFI-A-binding protein 1-like isoform X2 n=1 Tax=Anneissia japonica TaxID=1529436 RepID=UPI001425A1A3|nr:NGFI-A-binding protein 1-like isoform X2 [Anneissia japonica]